MKYPHYFKAVPPGVTHIDVYRLLQMFTVDDHAIGHAIKKLLVAGGRGAKSVDKDVQEAIDTLTRWQTMRVEDSAKQSPDEGFVSSDRMGILRVTGTVSVDGQCFRTYGDSAPVEPCGCPPLTCRGRDNCPLGVEAGPGCA